VPRRPDPDLESNILDAAQRLYSKGGERALTMRAVAKAAGTNTPSVYRRFQDRDDILRALLQRTRLEIASELDAASSPQQACERYLDFALTHSHEYELFYRHDYELQHSKGAKRAGVKLQGQPARDAMRRKLAAYLGGKPGDHEALLMSLWMQAHGAAMLLISNVILPEEAEFARAVFRSSVAALLKSSQHLKSS
jgi:AcrR family transcriptional regulator